VGNEVHEAVGQVMNYICHLDEDRDHILSKFKIEARRASATVLIGHPMFVPESFSAEEVAGTLRTYNSHHSRIEVMHYQDLIESAERALALAAAPGDDQEDS
jgi:predicted transcriptional regulator